ncbi:hypothetical protein HYFRA_00011242 [Hymenoscyphus fraxineus]|uniref:Mis6 domain protein n=1 Tax=Hymenoscyphus fraxineus TaxID=746836 RepID=A0A9N9L026_9HELO|nr:hypothetical protein HYFRA_00011242 [Hymenoscyphus fraxineus]
MDTSAPPDDEIEELLEDLEHAAKTPAKQRVSKIASKVERTCAKAYEEGLSNASLERVVDLITLPNELDQASINKLIKNLYPATKIPSAIAIKVVAALGHGRTKPSYSSQAAMLKWLVMVYNVLDNPKVLSQLYSVLFNLLDTAAIRPQLCHVLSLITRRKHVRRYRIQILMELTRQAGNEPPLVGLMRVFKDYYPDVIVGDVITGRASVFSHPNREWSERLGEIQAKHIQRNHNGIHHEHGSFRVNRQTNNGSRRTRSFIPEVHTFNAKEVSCFNIALIITADPEQASVTLEEIEGANDFIQRFEKIEAPNQLVAVVGDPLLQKFLQLQPSDIYEKRLDSWLLAFFEDQLQAAEPSETKIMEILKGILEYTKFTKILPPACYTYLESMVPTWNGVVGRQTILDLLSYTPIKPFEELYSDIFQPLEEAILEETTPELQATILTFYTKLLNNWTVSFLASAEVDTFDTNSITALVSHTNILATVLAQSAPTVTTLSAILFFYEQIGLLISQTELLNTIKIPLPVAELIYLLHFTQSLNTLSRLCGILSIYKSAFEEARKLNSKHPLAYINSFNGFLMDICNCIWRSRAFYTSDANSLGCLLPEPVTKLLTSYISNLGVSPPLSLQSLFGISFSPSTCLLAIEHVRELEDKSQDSITTRHPGPVTQNSLKQLERDGGLELSFDKYKLGVLMALESKGVTGIGELIYNTMKSLKNAREKA